MNNQFLYTFLTKFIVLFSLGIISFSLIGCEKKHSHPTDKKMIGELQKNRSEYDRLIELIREDTNLELITKKPVTGEKNQFRLFSKVGLSIERQNEYLAILDKIQPEVVSVFRKYDSDELSEVVILASFSEFKYDFQTYTTQSKKSYVWMNPTVCPDEQIDPHIKIVTLRPGEKQIFTAPCHLSHPATIILSDNLDKYNDAYKMDMGHYREIGENWYLNISAQSDEYGGE